MNLKTSKRGFKKENYESKLLRSLLHHSLADMVFIVAFGLKKRVSCKGLLSGGNILKHRYLNDYEEFAVLNVASYAEHLH